MFGKINLNEPACLEKKLVGLKLFIW